MNGWVLWIITACILAVGEMLTGGFFVAPFALGAALAALFAALGASPVISWAAFVVGSLLTLWVVRPIARDHLRTAPATRTGTAALIGSNGIVLERIANREGAGCVKIGGEVWTARALDEDQVIEVGARVEIRDIRGATALVSE